MISKNTIYKLWHLSPASLCSKIKKIFSYYNKEQCPKIIINSKIPVQTADYLTWRNILIQNAIKQIILGANCEEVLKRKTECKTDERLVEYCYLADWLLKNKLKYDLLDIGCVLNSRIICDLLEVSCNTVTLCNVAIEDPIHLYNPVFYHVSSLEEAFPKGEKFLLVTCLSTIEHIGYDNSQYGCFLKQRYYEPNNHPLLESLNKLASLTAKDGRLLISVPYGFREVLVHPNTGKIYSQVFDFASIKEGIEVLENMGMRVEFKVFEENDMTWNLIDDPSVCRAQYAMNDNIAAGAVAILDCLKYGE